MNLSRRELVLSALLSPLAGLPDAALGADDTANTLFVVIDGLEKLSSPDLVKQVLSIMLARGIPLAVTLNCSSEDPISRDLIKVFKAFARREPGLIELVLEYTPPTDTERYLQLREAIKLRDCLYKDGSSQNLGLHPAPIVSVIDRAAESVLDPYALRAAGFRIQIRPTRRGQDGEPVIESKFGRIDWGIAQLEGGMFSPISSHPGEAFSALGQLRGPQTLYLSFENAVNMAGNALLERCEIWAQTLQSAMLDDGFFITRPMDYLLQGNPGASKYVGLVLDMTGSVEESNKMADFASKLDLAGFPHTVLTMDGARTDETKGEICTGQQGNENADQTFEIICPSTTADVLLHRSDDTYLWSGPRDDGWYHAVMRANSVKNFARAMEEDPMTDAILLLDARQIPTPFHQDTIIRKFEQARSDGKAHFYTLGEYVEQTLAPDSVLEHFWSTRRRKVSAASARQNHSDLERGMLEDDARLAWQFLQRFTDKKTGLCAGTVQMGAENVINREITMWDVASQLNGIAAARSLAIIPTSEAQERVALILDNLPRKNVGGLSLPPSLFSANNPASGRNEFDACDTGRFLISLKRLVDSDLTTASRALSLLEQWDIAATVKVQQPRNFSDGIWENIINSHCSHYARNGYIHWGIPMKTAYPALTDIESGDQKLRLLYKAAFIGHFGSEPLLLEGLEVGYSPETLYLAKTLFDAQLSWFEDTGHLKCVSETPLNFAPWFAYQGLRVDRRGAESWVISTIGDQAAYQTEKFAKRADIISSKAAFMWAAEFPHDYSSRLLQLMREKARIEGFGFSVGIFNDGLVPMRGYSDLNTNGIILTAIAKMLTG